MQLDYQNRQLPEGWITDRIGRRIKLNYGKSQSGVRETGGKIPIYGTGGLIEYGNSALCLGNSVLIGRKGTLENPLYIDHPFWPVDTTYYTSDFDGCTKWLFYLIQTLGLEKLNEATGVPSLSRETFNRLEVPFPPKQEQEKIAEILTSADQAIEQTEALIAKYQRIKTGLMHDLLTRGLDEHSQLRDPSTHMFKPSPLGQIPMEWAHTTMEGAVLTAGDLVIGPFGSNLLARDYRTEGVPVVFVRDVREDGFQWRSNIYVEEKKAQQLGAHTVEASDVVITKMGMPPCVAAIYPMSMPKGIITAGIIRMRPRANFVTPFWIVAFINSDRCRDQVRQITGGLTRPKVTLSDFRSLQILIPPYPEQKQIESIFLGFNNLYSTLSDSLVKLQKLKTGLMQDLLTGKVSVEPLLAEEYEAQ